MERALLALWLIGAIVYTTNGASAQPVETASIQSEQVEVHSVVVDTPQVISLSHAFPDAWDILPSSVQLDEQRPATGQAAQPSPDLNEIEILKVNSATNIRGGPSASAEIIGIAPAGAGVQVASRDSGWVQIIDPCHRGQDGFIRRSWLCVPKFKFCNIDGEGRQGQVVR